MKKDKFTLFFVISFCFSMAANFAHPVTPTLIVERSLDSSMFGVALAAMMFMYFLFSPFWGKLCAYIPTKQIMLIGAVGYAAGQLIFGSAYTETTVIAGRMFAGAFSSGAFTAIANYVINFTQDDLKERGRKLVILSTVQNVGGACGYFIGGMLGLISVKTAFMAQVLALVCGGLCYQFGCEDDTSVKVKPEKKLSLRDVNPFSAFISARTFMTPLLALVFAITAVAAIGQNSYEQCFNYFIKDQYGMSSAYNGMFKAGIATLTLLLNSSVGIYLQKRTDINRSFLYILMLCTALIGSVLIYHGQIYFIAIYIIYSSVMVLRMPLLQAMSSAQATRETSNSVMGFYQSMNSLGGIFGALFAGLIYSKNPMYPFILAFIAFLVSTLIGIVYRKIYRRDSNEIEA
ncbi:MAG: MFS transporter [Solobacterium sp.]|nr:MFS transporter [Solobacterium sp.]